MSFILNFLGDTLKGLTQAPDYFLQTDIENPLKELTAQATGNKQAFANAEQAQNKGIGSTPGQALERLGGNTAQLGLDVAAPEISKTVSSTVPGLEGLSGITGSVARGAASGAPIGGAFNVAGAASNNQSLGAKDLTMDFLQGAGFGAALGGAGGAVGSAAKNLFSAKQLDKFANNESISQVKKDLTPVTGPVVAERIAPAVAHTNDPNIAANIIDQSLNEHLPSPAPTVGQDITPPSVSEPVGVGQGNEQTPNTFLNSPSSTGGPSEASTLGAGEGMKEILNNGGTVDEALNHHIVTTGSNYSEASQALNKIMNGPTSELNKGGINASLNPQTDTVSVPHADTSEQAVKNSRLIRNQVVRAGNTALQEVDKLSPKDMELMDQLRGNTPEALADQAENKAQFLKAAQATKSYNDLTQAAGNSFGQQVPYRQNYGAPLLFDQSTPELQASMEAAKAKLKLNPGYGRGRFFNSYDEGSQYGLQRQNENFLGDLRQDVDRRSNDLAQLALAKGLDEAHPGQIKVGEIGATPEGIYKQLQIPGGSRLSAPAEIADEINKRAPAPQADGTLGKYDTLNSNFKNLKLAGGGFHSINVVGSYLGQQLASGKAFTARGASDLADVFRGTFSDSSFKNTIDDMNSRGKLLDADASGLKYGTGETAADINPTGKLGNIPILKQIHSAIFDRQIPLLKLKLFDQLTEGLDRNNPEDLTKMSSIAKELNQNYGGINREIQGLTPRQFQLAARGFLATDYNEGQIRTLVDAFKKGGPEGKLARQTVFGKALLFGGLATAGAAAGGEFKGQTPQQVALDIFNKTINPSFKMGGYKVGLPTTQIAEVAKPIEQTVEGAKNNNPAEGVENFASSRLAAIPSLVEQLGTNKNFAGQHIYGTDSHDRPIPAGTTVANVLSQIAPIPASQTVQSAAGNQSPIAAIANTVGLRVTPQESSQNLPVSQQTYLDQLKQSGANSNEINASNDFFGAMKQLSKSRTSTSDEIDQDLAHGDLPDAQKAAAAYNQQLIKSLKPIVTKNPNILTDQLTQQLQSSIIDLSDSSISSRLQAILTNPRKYGIKTPPLGATSVPQNNR